MLKAVRHEGEEYWCKFTVEKAMTALGKEQWYAYVTDVIINTDPNPVCWIEELDFHGQKDLFMALENKIMCLINRPGGEQWIK